MVTSTNQNEQKVYIVGIGASAGGLEAISQLIGHLRPESPCAYVVLQHLSPSHRSMMVEILGRETLLKVKEAEQGDVPQSGVIYVVPANYNALLRDGHITLVNAPPQVVPKPSINQFLISLAAEEGEAAIGIVLSGTGSDGTAGLRAIQAAGGFTFAQLPETAKYDGMPRAAVEAGVADHVLNPEEIAEHLPKLLELPVREAEESPPPALLDQLLSKLRENLNFDFSGYKVGTLMRRIRRREIATGQSGLTSYLEWIEANPRELDLLARDILISVTAFFRDRDAFEILKRAVNEICGRKTQGNEIRVWVAGCATGEEAYSIAMLFADALSNQQSQFRVQIFATDIDDDALNIARRGIYPAASMSEVSSDLLERFFRPVGHSFEAGKLLRDMIVFARHNLVSDPPFLRLDLVSCRNVLIYFDAPLQAKVLQTFHFGLIKECYLFLGRSESVAQAEQLFAPIDRRERLFRKSGESTPLPTPVQTNILKTPAQRRDRKIDLLLAGLVEHFKLTAVLCDSNGNIQHAVGQVERYLQFPVGVTRMTLGDVVLPDLRGDLLTLLHRCNQQGKPQQGRRRELRDKGLRIGLRIFIQPLSELGAQLLLVLFVPEPDLPKVSTDTAEPAYRPETDTGSSFNNRQLEDELLATRENLQAMVEELATANEEMQALNEEAQASNEELQATNEEMEAANEELQATNEELVSLNEELNTKTTEYSRLSTEYAHLYDSIDFPILVFDRAFQLARFNAPAARRFDLRETALHQHVSRLRLGNLNHDLETRLSRTLAQAEREENLISDETRTLRMAIAPGLDKTGDVTTLVVTLIDVTEITRAQAALKDSEQRLTALMEKTTVIFSMKDPSGNYQYANRRFLEFFNLDESNYLGKTDFSLLPNNLAADLWGLDMEALRKQTQVFGEHFVEHKGNLHVLRSVHQVLRDTSGAPVAFITEAEDITVRKHAEDQLRITARVFDQSGEAIVVTDPHGKIQTINPAFTNITGYSPHDAIGKSIGMLKSGRHSGEFYELMWRALTLGGFWQGEILNKRKSGDIYPEWLTINRVDDTEGKAMHFVAVFSDITSIKDSQRKVEYLATHDALTGLPNRALFHDHLHHALAQARRKKTRVALLFIDLDNFKTINDTLGHDVGDELLKQAANRMREVVRDIDTVARLGGDEFTAILMDADIDVANQVCQRILNDLSASFVFSGSPLFVSASVGVAFFPDDGTDSAMLIKAADTAMYRAKEQGRCRVEFFKPDMQVRLLKRATIESALREALRQNRLRLVYQPKYGLGEGRPLLGAESLLRWHDPELGHVSPAEFIPVAESSGLILEIGRVVRTLLIKQISDWLAIGLKPPPIAMNLSPRCVREIEFSNALLTELTQNQIPAELLTVEITEGALLENSQNVKDNLANLHAAGIRISIDDFGTGYSSLGYLKCLPLSELKIDKSFVDGLGQDKEDEAIARAVLALAQALELQTVAEGVETERQLTWLIEHGCDIVQGYLLSKPLEAAAFEDLMIKSVTHEP
jgi:two-component system, chemotaxis family, CheB/CheR fusion protein